MVLCLVTLLSSLITATSGNVCLVSLGLKKTLVFNSCFVEDVFLAGTDPILQKLIFLLVDSLVNKCYFSCLLNKDMVC